MATVPLLVAPMEAAAAAPAAATGPIRRGGGLTLSFAWTYPTMDSHLSTMNGSFAGYDAMFNHLLRFELEDYQTGRHRIVGDLAESWEQPDLKTILFHLRKGVKFHDGSDFDSAVAKFNVLRVRDHKKSFRKDKLKIVDAVEAPDKHTLVLRLKQAAPAYLANLAYTQSAQIDMLSQRALEKLGDDGFARAPVGTGPFKFKQWITDDRLITVRNPDYFASGEDGKPLPYLDEFVERFIPDASVALMDMRAGTVHVVTELLAKDVQSVESDPALATYRMHWASRVLFYGGFNSTAPPFNDARVRQAALHAIDRERMAKVMGFGISQPAYYGEWGPGALGFDPGIVKYEFNPGKVKQLLAEAGHPRGIEIELLAIAREPDRTVAEFVQQMWTSVGIKTKLVVKERLATINDVRAMKFQTYFWAGNYQFSNVDPDTGWVRFRCGASGNWDSLCDKEIDAAMQEGASVLDRKQRHEAYRRALTLMQQRAYRYSGFSLPWTVGMRKEVQGLTFNFAQVSFRTAWLKR
jgi:ABC-type transport system substrate-binding protein